ncbi:tiggrin isoform X2 [Drosophila eugracilis]|uniref:tiggrin isoform X2 n=1 Tax=Drosophila eugracilis TaxID=29029 RepID=UPI001BDA0B61|nr:tiggrin isoform X2 [Drosophila eugracilis]
MRALGGLNLLLAIAICQGYQAYQRSSSRSSSSAFYGDEQSSPTVPHLNSWASAHFKEVRQMANQLKQKFNVLSQGSTVFGYLPPWTASILDLSKRSAHELDELSFKISQQLVLDMRQGNIAYSTIAQPNFFEAKAAELLERYAESESVNLQKTVGLGSFQPVDFSEYDEVKNYAYPAEVKVFEGKTYLVHRNCTETTTVPEQGVLGQTKHTFLDNKQTSIPFGSSMTTLTQKKTIRDWVRENMEPSVIGYNSVVNVDGHQKNSAYNQIATAFPQFSSDMIIHKFNKTITTNLDGTSTVDGSESQQRWQDGKLVFDRQNPISQKTVSSDEQWQREERERLFWYLTTPQQIVDWHQQQEERMLGVVHRYRISLAMLKEFHRRELARYQALLEQDQSHAQNISNWERQERGRLDWLIQQNCFTSQDLERWQNENNGKLSQIAQLHGLSRNKFQKWQREELQRIHAHLNQENELRDSQAAPLPLQSTYTYGSSSSLPEDNTKEQQRLDFLIGQHNATMIALQNSIKADQQRLKNLSIKYQGEMQSQTHWLRGEVARIGDLIKHQNEQVSQITAWQISERSRLETILLQHRGSLDELQLRMNQDRNYLQNLATKYKVSVEELETWQNKELKRLQDQGHQQLNDQIKNWQAIVSTNLRDIAVQNQLTLEEFKTYIISDRSHLEEMAKTYKVKVEEIEQLIKSELKKFQSEGLLKAVEQELILWQQKERDRLQAIVHQNSMTVEQLETRIKNDQDHFFKLADKYKISVEDIQDWLKKELLRLQSAGLIKAESLKEWQQQERAQISLLVQQNKYSFTELERKMLSDRARLQTISETYNIKVSEIEQWIKSEGDRLQKEGQLRMESQLNNWQKIEHQRLLDLINKNNLSIEEIESKISKDQTHLYSLAQQHQVRVEEIEQWIKKQIQNLQNQGLIEMNKLKDWQLEWRGNLTNMVQDRDFTVEEFHKWLLKDRSQLQNLAMQHNVQIEEIEQFVHKEEQRFIGMGLLKPNEKLTNWQEVERLHLKNLAQQQFKSTEQLEARLRQDRELLEHLARQYSVQVEEIESWMKQELARMRDEGQLQIDNLTSWQLAERERLETLIKQNQQWSADELRTELEKDREHMQTMAFQYHTSVEEIEKWIEGEVERLKQKGKLNIEKLSGWQRSEQHRIFSLLQQNSNITLEQFQSKIQNDRRFLIKLAEQHHVHIEEVEKYVKQVIDDLRKSGQFDIEQLQTWQKVERDYIKSLISEYKNGLSTAEYEEKLLADRAHLNHLADQYRLNVEQIEEWMIAELKRLRGSSEESLKNLSDWQVSELDRLQNLVKQQNHLTFVEFELELNQERERLQNLANKYSVSIVEIEDWLRQQLIKLRTTGQTTVENLSKWQVDEQQRLIELLLKKQQEIPYEQMEQELTQDNARLRTISQTHHVNIEQVDQWMREELRRLQSSGLIQFDQQTRWQQEISNGFKKWLKNQLNGASYKEFIAFLKRDKQRMDSIASEYHVTVEQVEKWVQKEAARLSLIGVIERPENHVKYEDIGNIWFDEQPATWKNELLSHLRSVTRERPFSQQEFESYLISNKPIFERITSQYHVTIADVHLWLSQSAKSEGLVTTEWQTKERLYIEELINQQHRKQQRWTIDELELWLSHDLKHLQDAVVQYHLTAEELKVWYKNELSRLVEQHKIDRGSDLAWHSQELQRIYLVIVNNTDIDKIALEKSTFDDVHLLASQYQTSVDKLRQFILNKLSHFSDLGILKDVRRQSNNWHEQERNRLREVAAGVVITEKELLDFVAQDTSFQKQLAQFYQVGLDQLAPVQRIFIGNMKREKLLEQRRLNKLTTWQQRERDRLYEFIGNQNITQAELNNWQNQATNLLEEFSLKYEITAQQLKDWQKKELGRINQIARYYAMSQSDLQQFREGELRQIVHVNHRWFMTPTESKTYEKRFQWALSRLQSRFGTFGQDLVVWRRTLFLLSQGLIDLSVDSGSKGGYVLDPGSTNATVAYKPIFSKDRGDQPPHTYEDTFVDGDEPGLEGEATRSRLSQPSIFLPSSTPPVPYNQVVPLSGLEYLRQYHTSNVPVGTSAASVNVGPALSSASASSTIKKWNRAAGDEASQQNYDPSQQLEIDELEWNENLKDLRQQEVEDHDLNLQTENLSQQQIQVEDVRKTHELDPNNSRNKVSARLTN